mmetsp:Transcript_10786/g.25548  ORF Transcript_10786/g.25548 Transcript_10786/m.25548 type:complete len:550 (+) Transcript_10786:990-2639(+)
MVGGGGRVLQGASKGLDDRGPRLGVLEFGAVQYLEDETLEECLAGFPLVEAVRVTGCQKSQQILVDGGVVRRDQLDGSRELSEHRGKDVAVQILKGKDLGLLPEAQNRRRHDFLPGGLVEQSEGNGNVQRTHRGLCRLGQRQRKGLGVGIVGMFVRHQGSSGRRVPAGKLLQVGTVVGVLHGCQKVVAGDGVPVVSLKIQVHSLAEAIHAQQRLVHANDLGPLVVDGRRVEVVHADVRLGSDRVLHRSGILGKLGSPQGNNRLDPLDGLGVHVSAEFLVAKDGESLLQRELEPVSAGDPVSGPVVKVLVSDDALYPLVVRVGSGRWIGQDVRRVEDVESLVFHRSHVEGIDRDDIVEIEVVFQSVLVLVPLHGILEGFHGVLELVGILGVGVNVELDGALAGLRHVRIRNLPEIASNAAKQIGRLGVGIGPDCVVAVAFFPGSLLDQVSVGQQHRVLLLVGLEADGFKDGHVVGTVRVVRDAAESHGLALGTVHRTGLVQSAELCVFLRDDRHCSRQDRSGGRILDHHLSGRQDIVFSLDQNLAVECHL